MIVDIRPFLPLTVGLVAAWFVVRFLTRRNIDVTGLEAAVVGLLAGPYGQDLMTHELICSLEPMINFALGALGLGVGMRLRIDDIRSRPPDTLRITFIIGLTTIAVVGTIIYVVLSSVFDEGNVLAATGVFTAAAVLAAPTVIDSIVERHSATGTVTSLIQNVAELSEVFGVLVFGIVVAAFHVGPTAIGGGRPLVPVEWVVLAIAIGVIVGLLFAWFLGTSTAANEALTLSLFAMVLVAAGMATAFHFSPLLVCLVCGATVVNASPSSTALRKLAGHVWRPLLGIVIFFAACAWRAPPVVAWVVLPTYLIVRLGARWFGGGLAGLTTGEGRDRPARRVGLSLTAQGGLVVAMALNAWLVYQDALSSTVLSCLLVAGLINEMPGPWIVRNTLIDSGEISLEHKKTSPRQT